jgi:hypothetical protein
MAVMQLFADDMIFITNSIDCSKAEFQAWNSQIGLDWKLIKKILIPIRINSHQRYHKSQRHTYCEKGTIPGKYFLFQVR